MSEPSDQEIQKIASLVLTQALMGTESIVREKSKDAVSGVNVTLEQVFRSKDALYIRYTIANQSTVPFRITTPDISEAKSTRHPISMMSLRNHQTVAAYLWQIQRQHSGASIPVVNADPPVSDRCCTRREIHRCCHHSRLPGKPTAALSIAFWQQPKRSYCGRGGAMSTDIRGNVTAEETRQAMRALYRKDAETNLQTAFARALADDLKPVDENGKWRPSTLLVLGCALLLAFAGVFVYFSIGGHR